MKTFLLAAMVLLVPLAAAVQGGVHPAEACAQQPVLTYDGCVSRTMAGTEVAVYYLQRLVGCTTPGNSCTYTPEFHVDVTTLGAGAWTLHATSRELKFPGNAYISGTTRSLTCEVPAGATACSAEVDNKNVVGDNFNSAKWDGSWTLTLTDAAGEAHTMATGTAVGWLAQYCNCPAD